MKMMGYEYMGFFDMFQDKKERDEEWSKDEIQMLNRKIQKENERYHERKVYAQSVYDMKDDYIEEVHRRRESMELEGDEDDIPWYVADALSYGQTDEEILENYEDVYDDNMYGVNEDFDDLYTRVFTIQYESSIDDPEFIGESHLISDETFEALGDDYEKFSQEMFENEGVENFEDYALNVYYNDTLYSLGDQYFDDYNKDLVYDDESYEVSGVDLSRGTDTFYEKMKDAQYGPTDDYAKDVDYTFTNDDNPEYMEWDDIEDDFPDIYAEDVLEEDEKRMPEYIDEMFEDFENEIDDDFYEF